MQSLKNMTKIIHVSIVFQVVIMTLKKTKENGSIFKTLTKYSTFYFQIILPSRSPFPQISYVNLYFQISLKERSFNCMFSNLCIIRNTTIAFNELNYFYYTTTCE